MAQPTPFFVTPSTTVVQVPTLQTPYTPVILNAFSYAGQTVTVLDATSSFGVLYSSIVVSTATTATYSDGSISTLINQPQGFVTLQSQAPNTWAFLNSFPFRNQYLSAGLYTFTTSTFTAASLSSFQQTVAAMTVEELVVSGNFNQSSPLVLNQTVSSFGSVDVYSTLSVYESAFFSSGLSTLGAVSLFSSLRVDGNVETPSSIQCLSSVFVSTSVSVKDFVSAGSVHISGGLTTRNLVVTHSSFSSFLTAGSLFVSGTTVSLSSFEIGSDLTARVAVVQSFSTLSSMAIAGSVKIDQSTVVTDHFSTQGSLNVFQTLETGDLTVLGQVTGGSNLTVQEGTNIHGFLSTSQLRIPTVRVGGEFQVDPTQPSFVNAEDVQVNEFLNVFSLTATSTTIGGVLSTTANAVFQNDLQVAQFFSSPGSVSTTGEFRLQGTLDATSLSSFGSLGVASSVSLLQDLTVGSTFFWNVANAPQPNSIRSTLSIVGNLQITGSLVISSIVLPSSVVANNFFVSSLFVGDIGIVSSATISSIRASSIGTGGILRPQFTMDMCNAVESPNLSTVLLSTLQFQATSQSLFSTFFQLTSSLGVGIQASTNTLDVNVLAYTLCNLFVSRTISTQAVIGGTLSGLLQGDGSFLSNTAFPKAVSTSLLTVSSLQSLTLIVSSLTTSTLTLNEFIPTSTFTVGAFSIFGNAATVPLLSTPYMATIVGSNNQLNLNGFLALGKNSGQYEASEMQGVIINPDKFPGAYANNNGGPLMPLVPGELPPIFYFKSLIVGDTLRVDSIKDFLVEVFELRANTLLLNNSLQFVASVKPPAEREPISFFNLGTTYISSGSLTLDNNSLFFPEGANLQQPSTNTIEPYRSTLMFNSTLFVNREVNRIGINTKEPSYTLDVNSSVYVPSSFLITVSTIVQDQLHVSQSNRNYWLGYGEATLGFSNVRYSEDGVTWQGLSLGNPDYNELKILSLVTDGGVLTISDGIQTSVNGVYPSGFLFANKYWVASGSLCNSLTSFITTPIMIFTDNPFATWIQPTFLPPQFKFDAYERRDAKFNGLYWVGTGFNQVQNAGENQPTATLFKSDSEIPDQWSYATSGGFSYDSKFVFAGGRSVAWNGSIWVVVGLASNRPNSILHSGDGLNWSNAAVNNGFFTTSGSNYSGGFGVVWTGIRWVAVGYSAGSANILYSSDALTWNEAGGTGFDLVGRAVGWNGSRLVACGESITGPGSMSYSDNHGLTWTVCQGEITSVAENITWNGSYWLAATLNGVRQSQDGISWSNPSGVTYPFQGVAFNSNLYPSLAIGASTLQTSLTFTTSPTLNVAVGNGPNAIYSSADGITWTAAVTPTFDTYGSDVAYDGAGTWVAVGSNNVGIQVYYSTDAATWTPATVLGVSYGAGNGVLYAGGKWVGAFDTVSYSMFYSGDGQTWINAEGSQFTLAAYGIGYGPMDGPLYYIAVGEDASPGICLYRSLDGITWSDPSPTGFFDVRARDIVYAGGLWVAAGVGSGGVTFLYSLNGIAWNGSTPRPAFTEGYGVAYNGSNQWVAVGYTAGSGGTIKYSSDGQTWADSVSGEFPVRGRGIAFNKGLQLWFATGDWDTTAADAVRYSGDGMNWSNTAGTNFTAYASRVATTGSLLSNVQSYYNQVRMFNNPLPGATGTQVTPYVASYPSSLVDMNNAITLDGNQNVVIQNLGASRAFLGQYAPFSFSTFINQSYTYVSNYVSTPFLINNVLNAQIV
jgi:hypothetical protein